jgi:hypothetical protein
MIVVEAAYNATTPVFLTLEEIVDNEHTLEEIVDNEHGKSAAANERGKSAAVVQDPKLAAAVQDCTAFLAKMPDQIAAAFGVVLGEIKPKINNPLIDQMLIAVHDETIYVCSDDEADEPVEQAEKPAKEATAIPQSGTAATPTPAPAPAPAPAQAPVPAPAQARPPGQKRDASSNNDKKAAKRSRLDTGGPSDAGGPSDELCQATTQTGINCKRKGCSRSRAGAWLCTAHRKQKTQH